MGKAKDEIAHDNDLFRKQIDELARIDPDYRKKDYAADLGSFRKNQDLVKSMGKFGDLAGPR